MINEPTEITCDNPLKYFPFNGKMRHFNSEGFRIISGIIQGNLK